MDKITTIYCDFDGTITKNDAVNTFFEKYADPKWIDFENLWINGEISSMDNAIKQVSLLPNLSEKQVDDYIETVEIDDDFVEFTNYLKANNIKLVILSDGFDLFIQKTLEKYNINDIEIYANHITLENSRFKITFPYHNHLCEKGAGMCKCEKINEKEFVYIGDGTSDLCVAKKATILFATKKLQKYCENSSIGHYPFNSFKDIIKTINNINGK